MFPVVCPLMFPLMFPGMFPLMFPGMFLLVFSGMSDYASTYGSSDVYLPFCLCFTFLTHPVFASSGKPPQVLQKDFVEASGEWSMQVN